MRRTQTILLVAVILFTTCATGCAGSWRTPFPDTDIVYQKGNIDHPNLGFVDADDGGADTSLRTGAYLIKPWWSADGKTIYALKWRGPVISGYLSVWKEGRRLKVCKEWWDTDAIGGIIEAENSTLALISTIDQILLVDIQRCKEHNVLLDYTDTDKRVFGLSLSPDQKGITYGLAIKYDSDTEAPQYSIIVREMDGGEPIEIGPGINPSWSPDGKQIAFIQLDGIYVMNSDGSNARLVKSMDTTCCDMDGEFRSTSPYPRWSPDGEWLIFHSVHPAGLHIDDSQILRIHLATGYEEIVANGGAYPFWR